MAKLRQWPAPFLTLGRLGPEGPALSALPGAPAQQLDEQKPLVCHFAGGGSTTMSAIHGAIARTVAMYAYFKQLNFDERTLELRQH